MSRLEVPLRYRVLRATGDVLVWADLDLFLKDNTGRWRRDVFRVDSGTEMTTMPAHVARRLGLPIPRQPVAGVTLWSQPVRRGLLRARVAGMGPTEHVLPGYFVGDPDDRPATVPRNLLGLSGTIEALRLTFDGTPSVGALSGSLLVERI